MSHKPRLLAYSLIIVSVFLLAVIATSCSNRDENPRRVWKADGSIPVRVTGVIVDDETLAALEGAQVSHPIPWDTARSVAVSSSTGYFCLRTEAGLWGEMPSLTEDYYDVLTLYPIELKIEKDSYTPRNYVYEPAALHDLQAPATMYYALGEIGLSRLDLNEDH